MNSDSAAILDVVIYVFALKFIFQTNQQINVPEKQNIKR